MTQQVRSAYRRHSWSFRAVVLAVLAVGLIVAIPIASGAPGKTYTFAITSGTPAGKTAFCTGGAAEQFVFVISNTDKTASLGSANITLPSSVVTAQSSPTPTVVVVKGGSAPRVTLVGNTLELRDLVLSPKSGQTSGGTATVSLDVRPAATAPQSGIITARVKQSNDFSDSGSNPDANAFENPLLPTLTVADCVVQISGAVYKDVNGNGTKDTADTTGVAGQTVTIGSSSTTTDANGAYAITVPQNSNQVVCLTTNATPESWVQTSPARDSNNLNCTTTTGIAVAVGTTSVANQDFLVAGGLSVPACVGTTPPSTVFTSQNEDGTVTVRAKFAGDCSKIPGNYVFTTYSENSLNVARLSPQGGTGGSCTFTTGVGCRVVTQEITWAVQNNTPNFGAPSYDDSTAGTATPRTMRFCKKSPLASGGDGLTLNGTDQPAAILPDVVGSADAANQNEQYETTCLISSTQGPGPTPKRVDLVYTAIDGRVLSP